MCKSNHDLPHPGQPSVTTMHTHNTNQHAQTNITTSHVSSTHCQCQGIADAATTPGNITTHSKQMLSGETGVNLDEEASRLIQFQQSYQAAAKVLQVAQTVFDTLLSMMSGR